MAIFGTTDESKFSVYLFFRIEEIADRVIERLLHEGSNLEGEAFDNVVASIINDEAIKARVHYLAKETKMELEEVQEAYEKATENMPQTPTPRPVLGVVKKDGTIESIKRTEEGASPELRTVWNLIRRIVVGGYGMASIRQLTQSSRLVEDTRDKIIDSLFTDLHKIVDEDEPKVRKKKPVKQKAEEPEQNKRKLKIKKIKRRPTR